ncbi:MAG: hypothetical protein ACKVOK_16130 [Flavobacteriales bacterium]
MPQFWHKKAVLILDIWEWQFSGDDDFFRDNLFTEVLSEGRVANRMKFEIPLIWFPFGSTNTSKWETGMYFFEVISPKFEISTKGKFDVVH